MDRFHPAENLSRTISLSNTANLQVRNRTVYRGDPGTVVTFGSENFRKGLTVLLTEAIQNIRLDGLLTLIATDTWKARGTDTLGEVEKFDMKWATSSRTKMRNSRHTLVHYLLQQYRFGTGEDKTIEREEDVRRFVGGMPSYEHRPLAIIRGVSELVTIIYRLALTFTFPDT